MQRPCSKYVVSRGRGGERAGSARRYLSSLVRLVTHHSSTYIYRFIRYPYLSRTLRGSYIATGLLSVHRRSLPDRFLSKHALNLSFHGLFLSLSFLYRSHVKHVAIVFARSLNIFSPYTVRPVSHFSLFFSLDRFTILSDHYALFLCLSLCVTTLYGDNKETSHVISTPPEINRIYSFLSCTYFSLDIIPSTLYLVPCIVFEIHIHTCLDILLLLHTCLYLSLLLHVHILLLLFIYYYII